MNDDIMKGMQAVEAVQTDWNTGAASWDPDGLSRIYTEDALFFGGRPAHAVGRVAIREYFASYVGVVASASMQILEPQVLTVDSRHFVVQGHVVFALRLTDGEDARSTLRATWVLTLREGHWKILQHHFSPTPSEPPLRDPQ